MPAVFKGRKLKSGKHVQASIIYSHADIKHARELVPKI